MPTLINVSETGESMGETARASDVAWMNETEFLGHRHHHQQETAAANDASTLSGTLLEDALREMRDEGTQQTVSKPKLRSQNESSASLSRTWSMEELEAHVAKNDENSGGPGEDKDVDIIRPETQHLDRGEKGADNAGPCTQDSSDDDPPRNRKILLERKMGPNEAFYVRKYQDFVKHRIDAHNQQHPGRQLPDYRHMNTVEKQREQQRVIQLLDRLGISNNSSITAGQRTAEEPIDTDTTESYSHCAGHCEEQVSSSTSCDDTTRNDTTVDLSRNLLDDTTRNDTTVDLSRSVVSSKQQSDQMDVSATSSPPRQPQTPSLQVPYRQSEHPSPPKGNAAVDDSLSSEEHTWKGAPSAKAGSSEDRFQVADHSVSSSSTQPVEVARADQRYESPDVVRQEKKRLATSSGKRGADLARARLGETLNNSFAYSIDAGPMESPSKLLEHSIRRLSLEDQKVFTASQSPIPQRFTRSPMQKESPNDFPNPDISFGEDDDSSEESVTVGRSSEETDTLQESMMTEGKRIRWDFDRKHTKEAPTYVSLKSGATFHLKPLTTKQRRAQTLDRATQPFPDPISFYPDKLKKRLDRLYEWIKRRDLSVSIGRSVGSAIVLSLEEHQIIDVTLKLMLENPPEDTQQSTEETTVAYTLIVARSKEDLEAWGRALREGSEYSVLDHASMPLKQRKSQSVAQQCAKFDVVFTTYDALKSPDATIPLDENGHAVNGKIGLEDGWYSSRTSASESAEIEMRKQFSVLHQVNWRRVVFVDVLGRKCFLAKAGTSRSLAAAAVNADSRLAYFVGSDSESSAVSVLVKSDKSALSSLTSVLRVTGQDDEEEGSLKDIIFDFNDKAKGRSKSK